MTDYAPDRKPGPGNYHLNQEIEWVGGDPVTKGGKKMSDIIRQGDVIVQLNVEPSAVGPDRLVHDPKSRAARVVAEGEGHHAHVLEGEPGVDYEIIDDQFSNEKFIKVLKEGGVDLKHLDGDLKKPGEHDLVHLPAGTHKINIQTEHDPLREARVNAPD